MIAVPSSFRATRRVGLCGASTPGHRLEPGPTRGRCFCVPRRSTHDRSAQVCRNRGRKRSHGFRSGPRSTGGKVWRIGFLSFGSSPARGVPDPADTLWQRLRELGHVEGANLIVEHRFAERRTERLPERAADLIRLSPVLIVPRGSIADWGRRSPPRKMRKPAGSCPAVSAFRRCSAGRPNPPWTASSRVPGRPTCPSSNGRAMSWSSTRTRGRRSASPLGVHWSRARAR